MWSNYVPNLIEIDQSTDDRVIDDLAIFSSGWIFKLYSSEGVGQTVPDLVTIEFYHHCTKYDTLLRFGMTPRSKKSGVKDRGQISHFLTPCKIRGRRGRMLSGRIEYTIRTNLWYTFDGRPLSGVEVIGVCLKNYSSKTQGLPTYRCWAP